MVDEVALVARCGRHSLLNSGDLLRTAGKSDDVWIVRLGVFLLTSGVSRSGSTVMKIGPVLCPIPTWRAGAASGPSVSSAPAISINSSDRCRDKKCSQENQQPFAAISRIGHRRSVWRCEREWATDRHLRRVSTRMRSAHEQLRREDDAGQDRQINGSAKGWEKTV